MEADVRHVKCQLLIIAFRHSQYTQLLKTVESQSLQKDILLSGCPARAERVNMRPGSGKPSSRHAAAQAVTEGETLRLVVSSTPHVGDPARHCLWPLQRSRTQYYTCCGPVSHLFRVLSKTTVDPEAKSTAERTQEAVA